LDRKKRRGKQLAWAGLGALTALACASGRSGLSAIDATDKGGLVPLDVPAARLEAAHAPRRLAVAVGIGSFDDPGWRRLRYPEKDAADLSRVLYDPERGMFTSVETLPGATRDEIRHALDRLAGEDQDDRDTVVLYVSTHGTLARDARGQLHRYLVTRDTRLDDIPGTALSLDELKGRFDAFRSRRKVLILAACHSGGGKSLLPDELQEEAERTKAGFLVRPIEEVSRATVVLAASDWGEAAREDERLENDIYTHYFVEALQIGADRNGDGAVTADEAHDYARRMTYDYTGGLQRPTAEMTEVGADAIVLAGQTRRKGRPELYSYAPALDGFTIRVDGRPLADLPGGIAVDTGRHRVQLAKGQGPDVVDLPIALDPGQRVDLTDLMGRAEGLWVAAPRLGALGFLGRSGRDLLPLVPAAGATLTRRDWPARRLSLRLDLTGSTGSARYGGARFDYTAVAAGVALPWQVSPGPSRLRLFAGPRLSGVYLTRRFRLALAGGPQSYLVMTPGLLTGATWDAGRRLTLGMEIQADWALVRVDGRDRSSAFGAFLVGAGYRF
jgi:hypothetical protein